MVVTNSSEGFIYKRQFSGSRLFESDFSLNAPTDDCGRWNVYREVKRKESFCTRGAFQTSLNFKKPPIDWKSENVPTLNVLGKFWFWKVSRFSSLHWRNSKVVMFQEKSRPIKLPVFKLYQSFCSKILIRIRPNITKTCLVPTICKKRRGDSPKRANFRPRYWVRFFNIADHNIDHNWS